MPLFVDGPCATIDDLTDQDCGLLDVTQTCGINATTKLGLAHDEIETDLALWLLRPRPRLEMVWGAPPVRIEQVVVSGPLKRWETMQTLALVYRDAYFSQFADRYQAKWDEYSALTKNAYEKFVASGVGLVTDPLRQAGIASLGSVAGPQSGGTFYASVAWVNAAGQEGAASVPSSVTVSDGNLMTVSAVGAPVNATSFNVYAGATLGAMFRCNDIALPLGVVFTYVPGSAAHGPLAGAGQVPDYVRPLTRTLLRG